MFLSNFPLFFTRVENTQQLRKNATIEKKRNNFYVCEKIRNNFYVCEKIRNNFYVCEKIRNNLRDRPTVVILVYYLNSVF